MNPEVPLFKMKITLINVISLDSKLLEGHDESDIYKWSSKEDFKHFQQIRSQHNLLVMGSGTFNSVKESDIAGLRAEKDRLRIIMTSKPQSYKEYVVPGQLEFSNETPTALVARLEKAGFTKLLLVSGGRLATSFLKANLIDELLLTIEPYIFGNGEPFVHEEKFAIKLALLSAKKLNTQGTLLLKYKILK